MNTPATGSSPNACQLLIDWANEQDNWIRSIVSEVLATRRPVAEQTLDAAYTMFLAEKHLSDDPPPVVPMLGAGDASEETFDDLRLTRISNVAGVNAIAPGQEIVFNKCVTLLFGENAAGKTGYVRVLKRLASVRSAEAILADIRQVRSPASPTATIEFTHGAAQEKHEWKNEAGIPPFNRMSVFDAGAVALHVDEDLTYMFTPGDLALFRYVHEAVEAVRARLDREKTERAPKTNPFITRFERDPVVYAKIEALGASSDVEELNRLAAVAPDEEAQLPALRDKVDSLRPQAVGPRLQVASSDLEFYTSIAKIAEAVAGFDWKRYLGLVERVRKATERHTETSERAFADEDVPGILGPSWRAFVQAGETYLHDEHAEGYPSKDDKCLYCRQTLDEAARRLLRKYREYCNNAAKQELDQAAEELQKQTAPFLALRAAALNDTVAARERALPDAASAPAVLRAAGEFLRLLLPVQADVSAGRVVDYRKVHEHATRLAASAAQEAKKAADVAGSLRRQATEREKAFAEESGRLRTLQNRLTLRALLPEVRSYVLNAQWAGKATAISARIPPVLRKLTDQSKVASEQLLNQDFERLFQAESEKLRAPKVTLDFAGRKGQAARRKLLTPDHRLSAILSEGEQKVIALADFLAEASLRRASAPIVFDDPVNSLDYKRLEYVADRTIELAETRQVIIFTHNIWFAAEILSRFEKRKADCTYYNVLHENNKVGVVSPASGPRWDTPKAFQARINELVQGAGKATGEVRTALVEKAYGLLRSWCEAFVEQEMLAQVAQRYQPNIMMTKLGEIRADRLDAAVKVVLPLFEKACRFIDSHSQPLETLGVSPTLEGFKEDWKAAQDARAAYVK